ncbi:MAG: type II secretion system F family protein [Dactylosporangium sp.]|nr:type II secretion system F family protein [Dactylosporangium sp.]NNJ63501.1 type II secretion system F family protein [Dactylosporangium sp.]
MSGAWQLPAVIIGGGVAGLGAFLLMREALPATPALGPALRRWQPAATALRPGRRGPRVQAPHRALLLLGRTREQYVATLLASAVIGLLLPPLAAFGLAQAGLGVPVAIPVATGLACAGLFALMAHRDVLAKADRARREFVRAVCIYLDLVALQLGAAHGPVQAVERAAEVCQGWPFERIREGLLRAQMQLRFPWQELREMADQIGVPELGDLGAIMQTSGTDGAQVGQTLRQRADSLRDQIRTGALARAEAVTSRLDIPGAALVFVLTLFVLYPFMARI